MHHAGPVRAHGRHQRRHACRGRRDRIDIPDGLFCYRVDQKRFVLGGALSNGGEVFAWMKRTLRLPDDNDAIESQLAALPPAQHGLTILPLFAGERSTGWRADARAAIVGLGAHTSPIEILQAALESVALRFRNVYEIMQSSIGTPRDIVASGTALLRSPVWTQMMADTLSHAIVQCIEPEATSRGAALIALERLGVIRNAAGANRRLDSANRKKLRTLHRRTGTPAASLYANYFRRLSESQSQRARPRRENQTSADGCRRRHDQRQALSRPRRSRAHVIETKGFDSQDGIALQWMQWKGLKTGVISGRESLGTAERARQLKMNYVYQGHIEKIPILEEILADADLRAEEIAYMGDDLTDVVVMRRVGFAIAVANARPEVKRDAHYVTEATGGNGAVREVIEMILDALGFWPEILEKYEAPVP